MSIENLKSCIGGGDASVFEKFERELIPVLVDYYVSLLSASFPELSADEVMNKAQDNAKNIVDFYTIYVFLVSLENTFQDELNDRGVSFLRSLEFVIGRMILLNLPKSMSNDDLDIVKAKFLGGEAENYQVSVSELEVSETIRETKDRVANAYNTFVFRNFEDNLPREIMDIFYGTELYEVSLMEELLVVFLRYVESDCLENQKTGVIIDFLNKYLIGVDISSKFSLEFDFLKKLLNREKLSKNEERATKILESDNTTEVLKLFKNWVDQNLLGKVNRIFLWTYVCGHFTKGQLDENALLVLVGDMMMDYSAQMDLCKERSMSDPAYVDEYEMWHELKKIQLMVSNTLSKKVGVKARKRR